MAERVTDVEQAVADAHERLQAVSGMTAEEAKAQLIEAHRDEARAEAANHVREIREEAQRTADREAKRLVAMAIQRMAADEAAQLTVSVVQLPSDEMKGRIIGREGRNIRAFEQATGIDVIIDDTPEAVVLSGYNPIRREVARVALAKLIEDGRIHPGRIEETVAKSQAEVEVEMREAAEEVLYGLGIHNVHPEIVKVLGNLKFRTSYGQNQLAHSREVAVLAGNMAAEMGLDVQMTRRAGLLHDVGKGLTHEQELSHVELGYRLCKRFKEPGPRSELHSGAPRRGAPPIRGSVARHRCGRHQRGPSGGPAGNVRGLCQAVGEAGGAGHGTSGGGALFRDPGGPRTPSHGAARTGLGRGDVTHFRGGGPKDRRRAAVPRSDQGRGNSRNAGDRLRSLTARGEHPPDGDTLTRQEDMAAEIISGKDIARTIRDELNEQVAKLARDGLVPGLCHGIGGRRPGQPALRRHEEQGGRRGGDPLASGHPVRGRPPKASCSA